MLSWTTLFSFRVSLLLSHFCHTHNTSDLRCVDFFLTPNNSETLAGYLTIYPTSDTVYLERQTPQVKDVFSGDWCPLQKSAASCGSRDCPQLLSTFATIRGPQDLLSLIFSSHRTWGNTDLYLLVYQRVLQKIQVTSEMKIYRAKSGVGSSWTEELLSPGIRE